MSRGIQLLRLMNNTNTIKNKGRDVLYIDLAICYYQKMAELKPHDQEPDLKVR